MTLEVFSTWYDSKILQFRMKAERAVMNRHSLPREAVGSPSLEALNERGTEGCG